MKRKNNCKNKWCRCTPKSGRHISSLVRHLTTQRYQRNIQKNGKRLVTDVAEGNVRCLSCETQSQNAEQSKGSSFLLMQYQTPRLGDACNV